MGWATGVQFPLGAVMGFFSSSLCLDRLWGPPILLPSRYRGLLLLGVKRSGREADHSPPSSADVKSCVELLVYNCHFYFNGACSIVLDRSNTGVAGSNPARGVDVRPISFFCAALSCVGRGTAIGRSPVHGFLSKCLKRFKASEINSESKQD